MKTITQAVTQAVIDNYGLAYTESLPTLAEVMTDSLRFFGGQQVFGVGGDFAANLITGLSAMLDVAPSSNEMHAGFSACAQAEISGLGIVLTTFTVGSLPCVSAAALAMTEKLPVVFISGCPGESEISDSSIHHTVASASTWQPSYDCAINAFRALGMKAERLQGARSAQQPNMAGERFFQLVCHAYLNKTPVFIEVPRDLVFCLTQALQLPDSLAQLQRDNFVLKGEQLIAEQIICKLQQAKTPLLFIGEHVKLNQQLCQQLMAFCYKFNIPYATSWLAKGIFDESNALAVGAYNGVFSSSATRKFIEQQVDYILEVDTSIFPQDTNTAFHTGTHKVHDFANKTVVKGTVQNQQGVVNIFIRLLEAELPKFATQFVPVEPAIIASQARLGFHNIADTLNAIQQQITQSLVFLPEVGNAYFASYSLQTKQSELGRSWLTNPWYAAMGSSLPYARAVAKAIKQQQLTDIPVVITGDGGFNFQLNELIHFQRERLSVIILYLRNDIFHLGKSGDQAMYQCSTPEFNLAALMQAYGGHYHYCQQVGDFCQQFMQLLPEFQGIHLIEIPASVAAEHQSHEIAMLNLYIQAKNGAPEAVQQWQQLVEQHQSEA